MDKLTFCGKESAMPEIHEYFLHVPDEVSESIIEELIDKYPNIQEKDYEIGKIRVRIFLNSKEYL